jgi:predicted  nucleic acid-binding Zn-ribbon protein
MNPAASRRPGSKQGPTPRRRDDVEALIALVSLDQDKARRQATVASALSQTEAAAASAEIQAPSADLANRRSAITSRIPEATVRDYESALRHGLIPAAVATRGSVCWGCFHRLSRAVTSKFEDAQAFVCCPHCERVLFNPDWIERR